MSVFERLGSSSSRRSLVKFYSIIISIGISILRIVIGECSIPFVCDTVSISCRNRMEIFIIDNLAITTYSIAVVDKDIVFFLKKVLHIY